MSKFPTTYTGLKWTTYTFSPTDLASYEGSINFSATFSARGRLRNENYDSIRVTSEGIYYEDHYLSLFTLVTDYYPSLNAYVIKPEFRVICFTPNQLFETCRSPEAINVVSYNAQAPDSAAMTSGATSNMISLHCENVKYNYAPGTSYTQAVPLSQLNKVGDFMINFGEERPTINNLYNHFRSIKDKIFRDVKDQSGYRDEWLTPDVGITLSIDDTVSNDPANVSIKNSNDYPVRCLIKLILLDQVAAYIGDEYVKTDMILPGQTIYLECSANQTVSYIIPTIAGVRFV